MKKLKVTNGKLDNQFLEIIDMIQKAHTRVFKNINAELITLYWNIGKYISEKVKAAKWGDAIIDKLADYIQANHAEFKGFTRMGLYRMCKFYETYHTNEFVSAVLIQISWTNHLIILSKTKSIEEKEFYIRLSIRENYSSRELERQIASGCYERIMLSKSFVTTPLSQFNKDMTTVFKDTYVLDFLNMPKSYDEKDLQKSIVANLKDFILEFGKDFTFIGQEYRIQVGGNDYFIDLVFFHRSLKCLVVIELKIDEFKPEYIGKLNFYLEALDRNIKKTDENPSVGIILCKSKNEEVVKYALSRSLSPALIAEYKTKLIPKNILQKKLHELFLLNEPKDKDDK